MEIFFNTIYLLLIYLSLAVQTCEVIVKQGALRGQSMDLVTGDGSYCSFKGIPYAQPPKGNLRFQAPLPALSWDGVRNATEHGSLCPQLDYFTNTVIPGDEDCLFLNIYSSNLTPDEPQAVLVFIHGGGFKAGSGNTDKYGPDFLLRKNFNIVVVTMNYRLDTLGFLALGIPEASGNAGLKDQVMALKWVQENIDRFGGDPNKVTIMGQSVGGASVGMHMASPMSKGLFHRVIAASGSPYNDFTWSFLPEVRAFNFAKSFGCQTQDINVLLSCFLNATSDQLSNYKYTAPNAIATEQMTAIMTKLYQFAAVEENCCGEENFMCENLFERKFSNVNEADVLFGFTKDEGYIAVIQIKDILLRYAAFVENFASRKVSENFAPYVTLDFGTKVRDYYMGNQSINMETMKVFLDYITEGNFKYDIIRYYSQFPNNGKKYMYQFSAVTDRNDNLGVNYNIVGAAHNDDLNHLFDPKSRDLTLDLNSVEFEVVDRWTTLVKNFIHHGNPTPDSSFNMTWPEFDCKTMNYMDIGNKKLTTLSVNDDNYYKFWLELLESVGVIY